MARPQGQLERSMVAMSIGLLQGLTQREEALRSTRQGEYDQQVQVELSGTATATWGYVDIPVSWEHPFVFSPLQRDPQFPTPMVAHHVEFTNTPSDLVLAHAHVISWNQNDMGWLVGATVRAAVCAPNAAAPVAYAALLHLTFQAYAYPTDEELST